MTTAGRVRRAMVLVAALVLAGSCQKTLPVAPTDLTSGITIYEDANFAGQSALLTTDVSDLKDYKGPCKHEDYSNDYSTTYYDWNDCVSSFRVAPGWSATVYEHPDYRGESYNATSDVGNLQLVPGSCDHTGLNDCVSSIRVRPR